jgi:hypothetical protein
MFRQARRPQALTAQSGGPIGENFFFFFFFLLLSFSRSYGGRRARSRSFYRTGICPNAFGASSTSWSLLLTSVVDLLVVIAYFDCKGERQAHQPTPPGVYNRRWSVAVSPLMLSPQ